MYNFYNGSRDSKARAMASSTAAIKPAQTTVATLISDPKTGKLLPESEPKIYERKGVKIAAAVAGVALLVYLGKKYF